MVQNSLEEQHHDGQWELLELPKDESFIKLKVGENLVGIFVATRQNTSFPNEVIHVFETDEVNDDGEQIIRQMNGTTNLDRWMSLVSPGDRVKVSRKEDKKLHGQPKPLQMYEVRVWKSTGMG